MTMAEIFSWVFGIPFFILFIGLLVIMSLSMIKNTFETVFDKWFAPMFGFIILLGILFGASAIWNGTQQEDNQQTGCEQIGGHYVIVGHYTYSIKGITHTGDNYGCVKNQ